jgi:hypothetical protein
MNLEAIVPLLELAIIEALNKPIYEYGFGGTFNGRSNKVASHKLINSVQAKVVTNKQGMAVIQILMEEYGAYVNAGRLPGKKGVPIKSLMEWIQDRHLPVKDIKSTAFAIQKNIKKNGIRPAPFIDVAIGIILANDKITELLGEATYEDLINALEGI